MREWIPVSTSPKGRLALAAVRKFGARPFDEVTVGELAAAAKVTTGALYHHFGSKLGLYAFVREDVERRLLDRMEGAAAAPKLRRTAPRPWPPRCSSDSTSPCARASSASSGTARGSGTRPAGRDAEREHGPGVPVLGRVLAAAWREALAAVAEGAEPQQARAALLAFEFRIPS